ncbi:alpha-glucosidase [Fodinisporobacter ferrooxydans]|uniref:oligo-1,6-glucosidase n=1 Tax=Fodinisporobacter ferrooxydans TaxID=2901836 RepID=A0ABY4CDR2_9BACL|nr:alpha-glucosidase [Alicyclobacillaceae bacterium MYW30-H2]
MKRAWWKEAVVYQIYPRSFKDSNGDGIGDLSGIISRLDYLKELGIDVIWLSPVYKSPNDDNGYDISDYQDIMDEFGTLEDFNQLLAEAHKQGIKIMMDLVVNHTSDEHPWFVESRSSKDNPKRDYYIWRHGQNGKEPNNWVSCFSGPAWEYDAHTDEYYLHIFSKKQPDLNWENPQLRKEIYDMMRWWLDKGIDGFRMDVINFISKVEGLPDAPGEGYQWGGQFFMNGPRIHEFLQEMNREVLSSYDLITVGEMPGVSPEQAVLYTGEDRQELHMVFQFEHMDLDSGNGGKWDIKPWSLHDFKQTMTKWQVSLSGKGWNSLYLNNHDQPRMVSRFGNDGEFHKESAKMLATCLHMMQGTPYIYQGEELGMTNVAFSTIDDYRDIETINMFRERIQQGEETEHVMHSIHAKGRDNARTPMQWDDTENAGFGKGTPWLPVNPNYVSINARQQWSDPDSIFHYYQRLIQLRKQYELIVYGSYELILADHPEIYAYTRKWKNEQILVILNFFAGTPVFEMPQDIRFAQPKLLISNYSVDQNENIRNISLRPYEARVYHFIIS